MSELERRGIIRREVQPGSGGQDGLLSRRVLGRETPAIVPVQPRIDSVPVTRPPALAPLQTGHDSTIGRIREVSRSRPEKPQADEADSSPAGDTSLARAEKLQVGKREPKREVVAPAVAQPDGKPEDEEQTFPKAEREEPTGEKFPVKGETGGGDDDGQPPVDKLVPSEGRPEDADARLVREKQRSEPDGGDSDASGSLKNVDIKESTSPQAEPQSSKKRITLPTKLAPAQTRFDRLGAGPYLIKEAGGRAAKEASNIGERQRGLWNMLVSTVERSGYSPPQGRRTEVLDLACGNGEGAIVLNSFFGGSKFKAENNNVRITGIDIDGAKIVEAQEDAHAHPDKYHFIQGDATNLDQYPQVPQHADIVVIRHQQISESGEMWGKIVDQALQRVTPEGRVIITSYSDKEHDMVLGVLAERECEVVLNERNRWATPLGSQARAVDKNVAIVKRTAA